MSSNTNSWPRTLAARLTLGYTLIASLIFACIAAFIYFLLGSVLLTQVDDDLVDDIGEFNLMLRNDGLDDMWESMLAEVVADGEENLFFAIYSPSGSPLRRSDMSFWQDVLPMNSLVDRLEPEESTLLMTLEADNREYPARTVYGYISDASGSYVLQIAESLEERQEILDILLIIILLASPFMVGLSFLGGWFMARKSLQGVERVTRTAINISNGAFDQRVSAGDHGTEINRLAATFNAMLDKIQILIRGMREMNDNIAHDLKSPLARIRGMAETSLTSKEETEQFSQLAASTIEECDRLLHLINTMLDLSEAEAGMTPSMEPINLSELIRDACDLYQPLAADSGIELHCDCEGDFMIQGNRQFLQRLIGNLLDNAIKYTPTGGQVTTSQQLNGNEILVQVADTGPGISDEDLPRIFQRFYRCDLSRSKPGSGLGLSLALAIARIHLGSISVQSTLRKGSRFTVSLPLYS